MKPTRLMFQAAAIIIAASLSLAMAKAAPIRQTSTLSGSEAFEMGMGAWGVQRDAGGIGLYDRNLIEDDGPGVGFDQPGKNAGIPPVRIGGATRIKKILHIDCLDASAAYLFLRADAVVEINGRRFDLPARSREEPYAAVPVALLKQGDNEIILSHPGDSSVEVACSARRDILRNDPARKDRPVRSFTSNDGGKTWQPFDGEFMVRLHLVQYAGEGNFISPVIDLAKEEPGQVGTLATVESARLRSDAATPAGTAIEFLERSGTTPLYDATAWSDWRRVDGDISRPQRYLQWKAILKTTSPAATPILKEVSVDAQVVQDDRPGWASGVRVTACENPVIKYTSFPFAYEDPLHPKLVALRQKYHLDDIVAGSKTELEKFTRLRNWVSQQWKWTAPEVDYPDWDADEILTRKYGMCVQFAIVYMQCAIALGYQTRFAFSNNPGNGGHEVCEVWSNDYQKWIYMDSADNFHYVDRKTNIPMSLLETHDLILKTYFGDKPITYAALPNDKKLVPDLGICYGLETAPTGSSPRGAHERAVDGVYPLSRMWTLLRYMPRNNYYSQPYPVPICQGRQWDGSEYLVWEGPQMPRGQWLYKNFTARRSDLDWTINQVRFDSAFDQKPGAIKIQMGTVTPGFATFLVRTDGGKWQPQERTFLWQLQPRANRLEMRIRTQAGIEGPISRLELDYRP